MEILNGELIRVDINDINSDYSFNVPSNVTTIKAGAFINARKIRKLYISDSVTLIESNAFLGLNNLEEVNVPNNCVSINMDEANCPRLKIINIDVKIPDLDYATNKFINREGIKIINFVNYDESKKYSVIKKDEANVKRVDSNTLVYTVKKFDDCVIVTPTSKKNCNKQDLIPYIEDSDFDKFYDTHFNVFRTNINLIYEWIECINKSKKIKYFPDEVVMQAIPPTRKATTEFELRKKIWNKIYSEYSESIPKSYRVGFLKACYALGLFSGKDNEHKKALEFIERFKRRNDNNFSFLNSMSHTDLSVNGFVSEYADFMMREISNLFSKEIFEYDDIGKEIYYNFPKLVTYFKNNDIKFSAKNVVDYVKERSYKTRRGNESLYAEFKKYSNEYSPKDYNLMQDLFEKARTISTIKAKKIVATKDKNKEYYYKWLDGADPVNFVLGDKVGCCARINDVGDGILRASVTHEDVRNLAFLKKGNKIIGKCTAYYNKEKKYILFNNAELSSSVTDYEKQLIFEALKRAVKDQITESIRNGEEIYNISMGMQNNDLEDQIREERLYIKYDSLLENFIFEGYFFGETNNYEGDASNPNRGQCILYDKNLKWKR